VSDEKLRELERAFQESGSEEAELAWLRERARAGEKLDWESYSRLSELDVEAAAGYLRWRVETGDLSHERLEMAAHCGDIPACVSVGLEFRDLGLPGTRWWEWTHPLLSSLARWGTHPCVWAVGELVESAVERRPDARTIHGIDAFMHAIRGWIAAEGTETTFSELGTLRPTSDLKASLLLLSQGPSVKAAGLKDWVIRAADAAISAGADPKTLVGTLLRLRRHALHN